MNKLNPASTCLSRATWGHRRSSTHDLRAGRLADRAVGWCRGDFFLEGVAVRVGSLTHGGPGYWTSTVLRRSVLFP